MTYIGSDNYEYEDAEMDNMKRDRMEEQEHISEQAKDTSPFVKSRRIMRHVRIQEVNTPPSSMFDTTVEYLSTDLPEWFAGLQSIVEDETFTSMDINLGSGKVRYLITIAGDILPQESE